MRNPVRDVPHYLRVFQAYLGARIYLVFALTLVAALAEGFGILMVLPLLQGLDSGANFMVPTATPSVVSTPTEAMATSTSQLTAFLQDFFTALGLEYSTVTVLLLITFAFLLKGLLTFGALGFNAYLRGQLLRELKLRLFGHYSHMNYRYYASRDTGHFLNVINEQVTRAVGSFYHLTGVGTQIINSVIYLGLAFLVAWRFGLMALFIGLTLLMLFRWLNEYVRQLSRKTAKENGHLTKLLIQSMHAFKYLTATGQFAHVQGAVKASIERLTGYEIRTGIAAAFTGSIYEPIAVTFIMLIVVVQIVYLQQPLAPILVSILLFHRGLNAILGLQGVFQNMLQHIGSLEVVHEEFVAQRQHFQPDGIQSLPAFSQGIRLSNVHFSYDPNLGDVLQGISLDIQPRTTVALVGESGAGKTTLVDLLTLMLKPSQGQILIDGLPGDQVQLPSWRNQIGYVSQETVVFDDTIANNICLWGGDSRQDAGLMNRIRFAAQQAHIAHFIETLPDQYETIVGDRGVRLSGGQRQRLFIARELFRKPNLLILDEATSALDTESERAIQKSIDSLRGHITVVIIAHRLSTIRNVDQVYVFDHGRLIEQGTYQQLRDAKESRFGKLVSMQAL